MPEVAQSLVLTRVSGRASPMPERETLAAFGATGATLAIHLAIHALAEIVGELTPLYGADCPVGGRGRARRWPDERIVRGTLADIEAKLAAAADRAHGADPRRTGARRPRFPRQRALRPGLSAALSGGGTDRETARRAPAPPARPARSKTRISSAMSARSSTAAAVGQARRGDDVAERHAASAGERRRLRATVLAPRIRLGQRRAAARSRATSAASASRSAAPRLECRSSMPCASLVILATPPATVTFGDRMPAEVFQHAADEVAHVDQRAPRAGRGASALRPPTCCRWRRRRGRARWRAPRRCRDGSSAIQAEQE